MKVKVAQSCLTLCDPIDCTVHGILQARILEWVAIPFSRGSSQPRDQTQGSNPGLPCCRQILYPLSHQGSPVSACFSAFHLRNWKDVALILAPFSPSSESFSRNPALQSTLSSSLLLKGVFQDSSECLFSLHQVNKSDFVRLHFCSLWSLAD